MNKHVMEIVDDSCGLEAEIRLTRLMCSQALDVLRKIRDDAAIRLRRARLADELLNKTHPLAETAIGHSLLELRKLHAEEYAARIAYDREVRRQRKAKNVRRDQNTRTLTN